MTYSRRKAIGDDHVQRTGAYKCVSGRRDDQRVRGYDQAKGSDSIDAYQIGDGWNGGGGVGGAGRQRGNVAPSLRDMTNGASFRQAYAPGMLLSRLRSKLAI